jgi:hypothetical protein
MVLISKYRTVAIAMFTSVLLAVTSSTSRAQELPLLKQGMPYSEARQLLLDSGWQALLLQWNYRESKPSGVAESLINDFGYDELVDCAGTGLGFCPGQSHVNKFDKMLRNRIKISSSSLS